MSYLLKQIRFVTPEVVQRRRWEKEEGTVWLRKRQEWKKAETRGGETWANRNVDTKENTKINTNTTIIIISTLSLTFKRQSHQTGCLKPSLQLLMRDKTCWLYSKRNEVRGTWSSVQPTMTHRKTFRLFVIGQTAMWQAMFEKRGRLSAVSASAVCAVAGPFILESQYSFPLPFLVWKVAHIWKVVKKSQFSRKTGFTIHHLSWTH